MKFKFKSPARMLITASILLSCSINCFAQKENKKLSIGIFAESGLPLGDAGKIYKSDFGTSLRLSVHAGPGFITLSGGAVFYIPNLLSVMDTLFNNVDNGDTSLNISQFKASLKVPFKIGYNYIISHHFSVMPEVGYSQFYTYWEDNNFKTQHTNSSGFTYALSGKFQTGLFEIGLKYEALILKNITIADIGVKLGFNF